MSVAMRGFRLASPLQERSHALAAPKPQLLTGSRLSSPAPRQLHSTHRSFTSQRRVVAFGHKVEKITGEELEVAIQDRDTPLVVDFFATWCGPCLLLAKELEKVAETLGDKVRVVKIDVDENPDLSRMLKIEGLPTVVFIPKESGRPALRTEGLMAAPQIIDIVNSLDKSVPIEGEAVQTA